jgi:hypothetical protein
MELQNTVQESSSEKLISSLATTGSALLKSTNNCIIGTRARTHTHTHTSYVIRNIIS